jgi:adenylosuccinate synthase
MKDEMTWAEVGQPEEYTTVTKKVRRVGAWDPKLARNAVIANGGGSVCRIALMFLDYVFPELKGQTDRNRLTEEMWAYLDQKEQEMEAPIRLLGTGPDTMIDLR